MGLNDTTDAKNKVQGTDNALWKGRVYLLNGEGQSVFVKNVLS